MPEVVGINRERILGRHPWESLRQRDDCWFRSDPLINHCGSHIHDHLPKSHWTYLDRTLVELILVIRNVRHSNRTMWNLIDSWAYHSPMTFLPMIDAARSNWWFVCVGCWMDKWGRKLTGLKSPSKMTWLLWYWLCMIVETVRETQYIAKFSIRPSELLPLAVLLNLWRLSRPANIPA